VSYVVPKIWPGRCDEHRAALASLGPKDGRIINVMIFNHIQYLMPMQTDSYQKESWRVARYLEKFGTLPLVFNRRNFAREEELLDSVRTQGRPFILVSVDGISSPFAKGWELVSALQSRFLNHIILDLKWVKAQRPYDLLGVMEHAACTVTIDSMLLHLSNATRVPMVSLINDGWCGSVPPTSSRAVFRYKDALADINAVVDAVAEVLK
jgi:hypothetical protein